VQSKSNSPHAIDWLPMPSMSTAAMSSVSAHVAATTAVTASPAPMIAAATGVTAGVCE